MMLKTLATMCGSAILLALQPVPAEAQMTLREAIRRAVHTNPAVAEASANRRATDQELRQSQGALLPQIRVQADIGPERSQLTSNRYKYTTSDPSEFVNGRQAGVVVRQLIFDGFASTNEIWRNAARVDASSWRVQERSELVALDTVQSYIDILRISEMIGHSDRNIAVHRRLLSDVQSRFDGGRAGRGDLDQVQERVFAAEAARAELEARLGESVALFRRAVGQPPVKLTWPARPQGLPTSRAAAADLALGRNPTLQAADSDLEATKAQRRAADATNLPTVALEGRLSAGKDTQGNLGRYNDASAKLSASWLIYSGGTNTARQYELSERVTEQSLRFDVLRRQANESIDKAWTTRIAFQDRIRALTGQVRAAERVIAAYRSEYDLGQRTLLDLLNAEQSRYNAQVALIGAKGLSIFADYQLLAATGTLLASVGVQAPAEARAELGGMRAAGAVLPPVNLIPKPPAAMLPGIGN